VEEGNNNEYALLPDLLLTNFVARSCAITHI